MAVFGCGRMGRLHARVYSEMPSVRLAGVYDRDPAVAAETARLYGTRVFASPQDAIGKVKAATVAVPTVAHLDVARPLLENGVACLIEKPLAKDAAEGRAIVELAKSTARSCRSATSSGSTRPCGRCGSWRFSRGSSR